MRIAKVIVEYNTKFVDKPFTYIIDGFDVKIGCRVAINFAHKSIIGMVVDIEEKSAEWLNQQPYKLKTIDYVVDKEPLINEEGFMLAEYMHKYCAAPLIACFNTMLPSALKSSTSHKKIKMVKYYQLNVDDFSKFTSKQQEALNYLKQHQEVTQTEFNKLFSVGRTLVKKEAIKVVEKEASATLDAIKNSEFQKLTNDQQQAFNQIKNSNKTINLLHGVTGSGKTEIFMHLAKDTIDKGKQVLVLVPEIALTPQMEKQFKERFGKDVAIYHSGLNNQERYEQFKLAKNGEVKISVGTRSSVFMPFDNLGLIIMDEEHENSYKQDSYPSYHARDIAIQRSKYHNCKLLLASATPSLESYARAYKGNYELIELKNRINGSLPQINLIDMSKAIREDKDYILSDQLKKAIQNRLDKNQQVILMLNRRGYAPIAKCLDCGNVIKCDDCDIAMTYHKEKKQLICHSCGKIKFVQNKCPNCGSRLISYDGIGTQKVEEHLNKIFSTAKVLRIDADTTTRKGAHKKLLKQFENHEYDILIGTQMIAKGLDFPNVTLVGILNGDSMLKVGDYHSSENTFDLLVQASGRSGRGDNQGEVYIQVYDENSPVIQAVKKHDYDLFFKQEMHYRHLTNTPPYFYMTQIILSNKDEYQLNEDLKYFNDLTNQNIIKLGPVPLLKRRQEYRYRIIIKSKDNDYMVELVNRIIDEMIQKGVKSRIDVNINPLSMES